ncbi:MAG: insulinase family protein [Vicinamibacterales bacterium]|nr:insulinase family protein [Vicinamibacterales bacterium]
MNTRIAFAPALAAVLVAATATAPRAQELAPEPEVTTKGAVIKGRAPISDEVLKITRPVTAEASLPNGLRVLVIEDRRAPQVRFDIVIPGAGGYFDPADHIGLAQFTAAMLREGAGTRSSPEIAEQLERLAASLDVTSGMASEDATLSATCLTEQVDVVLGLAADVLLAPTFPEQELARYKARARAASVQQRTQPTFLVTERLAAVLAGDHPAGRGAPPLASIDKTTRDHLVAFHGARYVPDHAAIAFIGDISLAEAVKKVEARFGTWKKAGVPAPVVVDPAPPTKAGIHLVDRPKSVQTVLRVGAPAIRRTDPDFPAFSVLNRVLGGGGTGRLFRHLREEKGYTYGAYSFLATTERYAGRWNATIDMRTEVTGPALADLLDEIRQVREVRVPDKDLADAKRAMVANFALSLESPQAVLANALRTWRWQLPADYWEKYPAQLTAVTPADAQAMAKKYLDPGKLQIVAVGDGAAIGPVLRKLGEVEVYDTEGRVVAGGR